MHCSRLIDLLTASLVVACFASGSTTISAQQADRAGVEFFEAKIRPVLVENCYECHSERAGEAKKLKGGLQLDSRAGVRAGGDTGPAVVPGNVENSLLLEAIRYESFEMPPSGRLPESVVADFVRWVEMGAPDPRSGSPHKQPAGVDLKKGREFWAFQPFRKFPVPHVEETGWPRSDLDHFVLNRLEENGLRPSAPADRRTLLRRAYFDLIGLPPEPAAIERFINDRSPDAFAKVVDRLLASPHFGERWARHWLDVVRFAESTGGGRTRIFHEAWRFRDYVVEAFNRDKPIDRFIAEQVAGDLMPRRSLRERREALVATGFLVLGPINYELQDKELLRMEVVDEQINTIGRAFLGMTLGCARCHDHKFDPIPTADYYALAGIFRSTKSLTPGNVSGYVTRPLPVPPQRQAELDRHRDHVAQLELQMKSYKSELAALRTEYEKDFGLRAENLAGVLVDDADAELVGDWSASTSVKPFVGRRYLHDGNAEKGSRSATFFAKLPDAGYYEVRLAYTAAANRATNVPVTIAHAEGKQTVHVDQTAPPPPGMLKSLGRFRFEGAGRAAVTVSNAGTRNHVIADAVQFIPVESLRQDGEVAGQPDEQTRRHRERLQKEMARVGRTVSTLEAELRELEANGPAAPPEVMSVREHAETGDYRICIRGDVHNLGRKVPRGFLSLLSNEPPRLEAQSSGRLELARWLVSPENPLTARVFVNRVWQHLLGVGLVSTPDNLGAAGQPPTHPKLLDYLAVTFVEQGWSLKSLVRRIVLSRVYQQSSETDASRTRVDPEIRLLWRARQRRLDAEAIRDAILACSGRLETAIGGPTICGKPQKDLDYKFDTRRRSLYIPVFRNKPQELLAIFDAANPNLVTGRRAVSTLPTQALYLMNSRFIIEEAQRAARRLLTVPALSLEQRIERAYQQTLGRPPQRTELELAREYLAGSPSDRVGSETAPEQQDQAQRWAFFYQTLFACVDFRYIK